MKQLSNKKSKILLVLGLLLLTVAGVTLAYYAVQKVFQNEFKVKEPGIALIEKYNPSDHWVPGEEKSKEVLFTNTEEQDMLLRFSFELKWADGQQVPGNRDVKDVVKLYWTDEHGKKVEVGADSVPKGFVKRPSGNVDYYYYTQVLKGGKSTPKVLESVKLETNMSNDEHFNSDFSDKKFELTIKGETVLADEKAVAEQWKGQVTATIGGNGTVTWN